MLRQQSVNIKTKLKITKGRPDLTPLVDVLFLLLIFFMLSSSFVQLSGIEITVPETHISTTHGVHKVVITVDKNSKVFFNDQEVTIWDDLKKTLLEVRNEVGSGTSVIIRADAGTNFGTVARLLAIVEEIRLNAFVLTKPATEESFDFK